MGIRIMEMNLECGV